MYPQKLDKIIDLFESLPEQERRETIEALQREKLSLNAMAARLNADSVRVAEAESGPPRL